MTSDERRTTVSARNINSKLPSSIGSLYSRRAFAKLALAALPGASWVVVASGSSSAETPSKPNSKVAGVQLGLNVPYSFANPIMSGDDILKRCLQLRLSAVELRTQPVEVFMGAPSNLIYPKNTVSAGGGAVDAEQLRQWRRSASMERAREFRDHYEAAGVLIEIVKVYGAQIN